MSARSRGSREPSRGSGGRKSSGTPRARSGSGSGSGRAPRSSKTSRSGTSESRSKRRTGTTASRRSAGSGAASTSGSKASSKRTKAAASPKAGSRKAQSRKAQSRKARARKARDNRTAPATRPARGEPPARDARARRSFLLRAGVGGLAAIAFLFVFVYPTSSIWDQRNDIRDTREQVDLVRTEADRLEWELARLGDDEVVSRLARERFHLVRPGETAWAVVPGPVTTPAAADEADEPVVEPEPEAPPLVP